MRVTVDETLCEAQGFCESLAPDIFELGDEDVVQIADGEVAPDRRSTSAPRWTSARRPHCGCRTEELRGLLVIGRHGEVRRDGAVLS